jgi:hypothetical protein
VIIWGSGNGGADLGVAENRACETCEKERPFKVLLQYKYAHLYHLRWVTEKAYYLACDVCRRGVKLDPRSVEAKLKTHPIPFMTRNGWMFLVGGPAMFALFLGAIAAIGVASRKEAKATETPSATHADNATTPQTVAHAPTNPATMTPLKNAFENARFAGTLEYMLPEFRRAQLYVVVQPDPADPAKQVFLMSPSPKPDRQAVTVAESLDTFKDVSWPKRRITGAQLMAELTPDQEIVIAYKDGGDYLTREQLEWLRKQQ